MYSLRRLLADSALDAVPLTTSPVSETNWTMSVRGSSTNGSMRVPVSRDADIGWIVSLLVQRRFYIGEADFLVLIPNSCVC